MIKYVVHAKCIFHGCATILCQSSHGKFVSADRCGRLRPSPECELNVDKQRPLLTGALLTLLSSQLYSLAIGLKDRRDHKQIMAEPLGAISAVVGIGTFLVQVGKRIKDVRKAINYNRYQASDDLVSLEADLKSLHQEIEARSVFQDDPLVMLAIAGCRQAFMEMEPDLDMLTRTLAPDQSRKSRVKLFMKPTALKTEETVKDLRLKVGSIVHTLLQ